jgi:hypothetical protein
MSDSFEFFGQPWEGERGRHGASKESPNHLDKVCKLIRIREYKSFKEFSALR